MRSLGVLLLLAAPAVAQPYTAPDFMTQPPPLPEVFAKGDVWRLDLSEALRLALHDNLGIAVERESVRAASLGITVADGEFEPTLTAGYSHGSSRTPPTTVLEGGAGEIVTTNADDWRMSIAQRLSTGMRLELDFVNDRSKTDSHSAVEPLNYRSSLSATITQPVLRGFSTDRVIPRIDILRAKIANDRERMQMLVTASDVIEKTEDAYWDVEQALYRYDLELQSQKRAVEQMDLTKRQIAAGLLPPGDLTAAEATLASRDLQVLQAEQAVESSWDVLRAVLNLPHQQWARPILPTDMPGFAEQTASADDMLRVAIEHRPELAQAKLDLAAEELAVRKADNDRLPQIDVGLSGSLYGQDSTYHGALAEYGRADATAYNVFVNFTWTPLQRATRAAAEIERTRHQIAVVQHDQSLQAIWLAVRDAVRTQANAARQVYAAAKFRELSTKNLEIEQRKFVSGQSSNFFIAQRQEELAQAQQSEVQAVLAHKKATAALLKATGRLLEERHVSLR
jgi:outer membrane protein TolC